MTKVPVKNHENNLKFALFMNAKVVGEFPDHKLLEFPEREFPDNWRKYHASTTLNYDKSFDWLLPVVKKVTLLCKENNRNDEFSERWQRFFDYQSYNFFTADLEPVYSAVVEFLDWYNEYKMTK